MWLARDKKKKKKRIGVEKTINDRENDVGLF